MELADMVGTPVVLYLRSPFRGRTERRGILMYCEEGWVQIQEKRRQVPTAFPWDNITAIEPKAGSTHE